MDTLEGARAHGDHAQHLLQQRVQQLRVAPREARHLQAVQRLPQPQLG